MQLENISEDMRVLYVALTRAKEKLYLIGTVSDGVKALDKWSAYSKREDWLLPDYVRANATSYMDWIGPALSRHQSVTEGASGEVAEHPSRWKVHLRNGSSLQTVKEEESLETKQLFESIQQMEPVPIESKYHEHVKRQLAWEYEYTSATGERSKQSVSELKRMNEPEDPYSAATLVKARFKQTNLKRPSFIQQKKMTPAERGTLVHLVMQHIDAREPVNEESIQTLVERLVMKEFITKEQAEAIDAAQLLGFFESDIGQRMKHAKEIRKEVPFTMAYPAREAYHDWDGGDENILVQGIVDCLFEDENGLVLVDYKTDAITGRFPNGFEEAEEVLRARYVKQIELYTRALEQILKREIKEKYLFFFDGAHFIKL